MSLAGRYKLFWAACIATLCGLAVWKNSKSYPRKSKLWRLGKSAIDTWLVLLLVVYAPALLLMYVVIWLTSPFKNRIMQSTAAFASILAVSHLAGIIFEAVAVFGIFAVDLLTGQVVARMDRRNRKEVAKAA
ncbi:MAG: hypothetical protein ACLQVM_27115 [Terriglobia bacterium]